MVYTNVNIQISRFCYFSTKKNKALKKSSALLLPCTWLYSSFFCASSSLSQPAWQTLPGSPGAPTCRLVLCSMPGSRRLSFSRIFCSMRSISRSMSDREDELVASSEQAVEEADDDDLLAESPLASNETCEMFSDRSREIFTTGFAGRR